MNQTNIPYSFKIILYCSQKFLSTIFRLTLPSKLTNCDIKWLAVVSRAWHPEEHYFGEILADITFDSPDIIAFKHKNCGCGLVDDKPPFPCLIG